MNEKSKTAETGSVRNRNTIWLTGIAISILLGALIAWPGSSGSDKLGADGDGGPQLKMARQSQTSGLRELLV